MVMGLHGSLSEIIAILAFISWNYAKEKQIVFVCYEHWELVYEEEGEKNRDWKRQEAIENEIA